jgi:phytanoyl-CoA hydroxylase
MQVIDSLRTDFETNGFVVIPGFKSSGQIAALRARAAEIVDAFEPGDATGVFSTKAEHAGRDRYFMESATAVRCFFEEEAFDERGALRGPKSLSINKIGHAMHDLDPVFAAFSRGPELAALARELGNDDPRVYQSMYIFKQPRIGGEVRWHQDATYFATEPQTVTTLWFALEAADRTNGCLWVQRGGHRSPLRERFAMVGTQGRLDVLDATPWPHGDDAEPIECDAGTLVVFHGLLPHYSAPNRSAASRHAYTLHYVDGRVPYDPANWIQRSAAFPARGFA